MIKLSPFESGRFRITSPFGWRTLNGARDYHKGIDIVDSDKSGRVVAVTSGVVLQSRIITNRANLTWQWGNYISYRTNDGYTVYCCHLDKRLVSKGARLEPGDEIGIMGNTGYSFGAHTHFEVRNSSGTSINAAEWLGIANAVGQYSMTTLEELLADDPDQGVEVQIPLKPGDRVRVKRIVRTVGGRKYGPTYTGGTFVIYYDTYDVISISGVRVVIGKGSAVTAAVNADDLEKA